MCGVSDSLRASTRAKFAEIKMATREVLKHHRESGRPEGRPHRRRFLRHPLPTVLPPFPDPGGKWLWGAQIRSCGEDLLGSRSRASSDLTGSGAGARVGPHDRSGESTATAFHGRSTRPHTPTEDAGESTGPEPDQIRPRPDTRGSIRRADHVRSQLKPVGCANPIPPQMPRFKERSNI